MTKTMYKAGFVLPMVVILSLILVTLAAYWYQQVMVQSHLAQRVISNRAELAECESLLPLLKNRLRTVGAQELMIEQTDFLVVTDSNGGRWRISRSGLVSNRVKFTFYRSDREVETVTLTVNFPSI